MLRDVRGCDGISCFKERGEGREGVRKVTAEESLPNRVGLS